MKQISIFTAVSKLALVSTVALLVACSSSDDSAPASDASPDSAAISGSVVAAPVSGASVQLKDAAGNALADPVTTGSDGSYSVTVSGAMPDAVVLESTGGTYSDEASGAATDAGMLMAYVDGASLSAGGQVHATPASTIVSSMVMTHGMTLSAAQAAFESAFGFSADTATAPADATAPAADATEEELLAGLRAAAFSQLTEELGLTPAEQFDLLTALATDLADGELDGENAGGDIAITASVMMPIDIQNRFVTALLNFHNDGLMGDTHGNDMTGLDNSQIGVLPFAKVATTGAAAGAYKVEYFPGMMDAMQGKTEFQLKISDDSGAPVSSTVELMLMMFMEDRKHSTPDLDCEEDIAAAGDYYCTVYYVMPSVMTTGDSMGYWQMQVMVDMKSAVLYPQVMMAMGETTRVLLKGIDPVDTINMMGVTSSRPYNLFRNDLSGTTGAHNFNLFIAPMEDMMNFPALKVGDTLNGTFNVNDVKVEFSTDASSWTEATNVGAPGTGTWGIVGLTGLTDGVAGKIYVKLSVDDDSGFPGTFDSDELKTTNGLAADGGANDPSNEYSFFNVTP
jgi:hypothetical protein